MHGNAGTGFAHDDAFGLNAALFDWFAGHGRDLAFRDTRDPYAILVAEVMLQQTQVARVEPAWRRFMTRFPTVRDLAAATPAEAIRAWAGLGYYARVVRLQRAAAAIVREHEGRLPGTVQALLGLPGIGAYTAHAVAATAFDIPVAAVDTNIGRVVRRVHGLDEPLSRRASPARVQRLADAWIDGARPAVWTYALMDVGATICLAREPRCVVCPLRPSCVTGGTSERAASRSPNAMIARRRAAAAGAARFPATRRWLRGRILARLREEPDGCWVEVDAPIGTHGREAVMEALAQLAADDLVELDGIGRARLPQTRGIPGVLS